jgi:hypothetical protein
MSKRSRGKGKAPKASVVCIYCGELKPPHREHPIPRSLGTYRGLEPLARHLCLDCNGELGKLDEIFARTGPEGLFRHLAGVRSRRHHRQINPVYHHLTEQGGLRVIAKHPDNPFDVLWEVQPGEGALEAREARQIVLRARGEYIPIALPETGVREFLKDQIKRRNLGGSEPVCFFGGDSESDPEFVEIKQAIEDLCSKKGTMTLRKTVPGHVVTARAAFGITRDYLRAMAKVAFHYFLLQRPQYTGREPIFEGVRHFIVTGEDFQSYVGLAPPITEEGLRGGGLRNWTHFVTGEITYDEMAGRVQLFVGPDTLPPTWRVRFGRNPSPIHTHTDAFGHKFQLFDRPAADGHQGEMLPLSVATAIMKPDMMSTVRVSMSRLH